MIEAGVDVFRLNFSHGSYEEHNQEIWDIREASRKTGRPVAIMQDLQGPKIRLGDVKDDHKDVKKGQVLTLDYAMRDAVHDGGDTIPLQYNLAQKVKPGEVIFIFDGRIRTHVTEIVSATAIRVEVENDGFIARKKGLNLPDTDFGGEIFTEKDLADLDFGSAHDFDYIAISFVQSAGNLNQLRALMKEKGFRDDIKIIAKIETKQALKDEPTIDEIVQASDAIMVARGDMAYEAGMEVVPVEQRRLIRACRKYGKPVIVATQAMETMVDSPVPTRAEADNVAAAVISGADAIMLSEESTVGKYPLETVGAMVRIIEYTENNAEIEHVVNDEYIRRRQCPFSREDCINNGQEPDFDGIKLRAIADSAVELAEKLGSSALLANTRRGATARALADRRPDLPILCLTDSVRTAGQLALVYGCYGFLTPLLNESSPEEIACIARQLLENNELNAQDPDSTAIFASEWFARISIVDLGKVAEA